MRLWIRGSGGLKDSFFEGVEGGWGGRHLLAQTGGSGHNRNCQSSWHQSLKIVNEILKNFFWTDYIKLTTVGSSVMLIISTTAGEDFLAKKVKTNFTQNLQELNCCAEVAATTLAHTPTQRIQEKNDNKKPPQRQHSFRPPERNPV